jgi:hypothetical protein
MSLVPLRSASLKSALWRLAMQKVALAVVS